MTTLLVTATHAAEHDTGPGHPERPDRMRAIDKVLAHDVFRDLKREEAPLRDDARDHIARAHSAAYFERIRASVEHLDHLGYLDGDTGVSPGSWISSKLNLCSVRYWCAWRVLPRQTCRDNAGGGAPF